MASTVGSHVVTHSPCVLTDLAGADEPTAISSCLTFSLYFCSWDMENNPDKTWSRSTAHPARRLVHSESGNCGQLKELTSDDLANLTSQEKFSRADWVCRRDDDRALASTASRATQGRMLTSIFLFAGWVSSSSSRGDLDRLDVLSTSSCCSSLPAAPSLLGESSGSSIVWDLSPARLRYLSKLSNMSQ